ncbi:hypothetical protein ACQ4LE_006713 [Meloidogyne hapla]|uniref:EIF-4F 25 kDa subunit n=2 Tax=Meloidogyne hapla TaxID=6305 RepID=A0A1I8BLR7_MELHA
MDTNGVTDNKNVCIDNTTDQEKINETIPTTQTQQQQKSIVVVTDDSVEEKKDDVNTEEQQTTVVTSVDVVSTVGGEVCENDNVEVNNDNLEERQSLKTLKNNKNNNSSSLSQQNIPITVSPNNSSISTTSRLRQEHRLKTRWTFWYLNPDRDLTWLERLKKVCTIESAESFWALFDNIRPPTGVQSGCDYNFFKQDIQPVWEVPENKDGGRLIVTIDKSKIEHLDVLWLELLVALIGEQFGRDSEYICGAVCNIRSKGHKICLWTKDAEAEDVNRRIGTILKSRFQDTTNCNIRVNYEEHNVSQHKSSSATQVRFALQ